MLMSGGRPDFSDPASALAILIALLFVNVLYFMMHYTGKTDRYRAVIFIIFALSLSFTLISNMLEMRNSMAFSQADILECKIPFCHLVIPMMILPAAFTESIIFPGSIIGGFANITSMVVLWFVATLVLGRGFCSWGCFYGGWDDGFSRLRKKPVVKKISEVWKWMPFAVLLMVSLTAALTLVPTYCDWICPFKAVTEFEQVTSVESAAKAGIFISLFAGLVVVLPVMTRKRTQCSFLCPLGAVNTLSNKITPFIVKIDRKACSKCFKCVEACGPLEAIDFSQEDKFVEEDVGAIIVATGFGHFDNPLPVQGNMQGCHGHDDYAGPGMNITPGMPFKEDNDSIKWVSSSLETSLGEEQKVDPRKNGPYS